MGPCFGIGHHYVGILTTSEGRIKPPHSQVFVLWPFHGLFFCSGFCLEIGRYLCALLIVKAKSAAIRAPFVRANGKVGQMRLANASKIRTIDFALSGIGGTGSISPRARRALAVYVALVKMDFGGIAAPMGAIADAVWRSSHGEARSIRTLQRANRELEERGFIRCQTFRPGERSKGAVILFETASFSYWTKKTFRNVQPLPTQSHNVVSRETMCDTVAHTTTCHASDRRNDNSRVNTPNIIPSSNKEPRDARAIDTNGKKSKRPRRNPVLFSLVQVLAAAAGLHRCDRKVARNRAEVEIKAAAAGVVLVNPSGVDWDYWEKRWSEMPIAVRESTIRREILPLLLGIESEPTAAAPVVEAFEAFEPTPAETPTAEDIRAARIALEKAVSLPPPAISEPSAAAAYPEIDTNDPEMRLLAAARDRTRARAVNGW